MPLFKGEQAGMYLLSPPRTNPLLPMSHMIGWKYPIVRYPYCVWLDHSGRNATYIECGEIYPHSHTNVGLWWHDLTGLQPWFRSLRIKTRKHFLICVLVHISVHVYIIIVGIGTRGQLKFYVKNPNFHKHVIHTIRWTVTSTNVLFKAAK